MLESFCFRIQFLIFFTILGSATSLRHEVEYHEDGFDAHMQRVTNKGWVKVSEAASISNLHLILAVRQTNLDVLEKMLLEISDPQSTSYGKHMSNEQVHSLVAPKPSVIKTIQTWLFSYNIQSYSITSNNDFIKVPVTVAQAEELLNTTYSIFNHVATNTSVIRVSKPYTVPALIAKCLDFVSPTIVFPPMHRKLHWNNNFENKKRGFVVTPTFLRKLYNLTDADVGKGAASNNSQAVASFIKQYYDPKDLNLFWAKYKPLIETPFIDVPKNQPHSPVGTEAALDTEYIAATGAGISTQHWYTPGDQPHNPGSEPFVAWLTKVASTPECPSLFSISYGDEENGVTLSYAARSNVEFQKAGVRGISLLAASGDSGAGCSVGAYVPTFPASSPWITAVGGLTGGRVGHEITASLSGGGFSNYFGRPSYQEKAVNAYFKQSGLPQQRMWNRTGAGFPDISAQALQFDVCSDAFFYPIDGTSCACPTAAGIFAMLNQVREENNKPKLGFLNPLIYSYAQAFNDVTQGKNNYCDQPDAFPATKGWDAATGFGSPNFGNLKAAILQLE